MSTGCEAYMNAYSWNRSVVMGSRHFGLTAYWSSEVINNRIHETQWQTLRRGRKCSLITLDKLSQIGSLFCTELMAITIWITMYSCSFLGTSHHSGRRKHKMFVSHFEDEDLCAPLNKVSHFTLSLPGPTPCWKRNTHEDVKFIPASFVCPRCERKPKNIYSQPWKYNEFLLRGSRDLPWASNHFPQNVHCPIWWQYQTSGKVHKLRSHLNGIDFISLANSARQI